MILDQGLLCSARHVLSSDMAGDSSHSVRGNGRAATVIGSFLCPVMRSLMGIKCVGYITNGLYVSNDLNRILNILPVGKYAVTPFRHKISIFIKHL